MGVSKFLSPLSDHYALAPSAVLIRVAEAELLQLLVMQPLSVHHAPGMSGIWQRKDLAQIELQRRHGFEQGWLMGG